MNKKIKPKGFTLIELLVVIVIIGILATLATVALNSAREKAKDTRRISDIKQMQTALELYFNDNQQYPPTSSMTPGIPMVSPDGSKTYMSKVPNDPETNKNYTYQQVNSGTSYMLSYTLVKQVNDMESGSYTAVPGKIGDVCIGNCYGKCSGEKDTCGKNTCANPSGIIVNNFTATTDAPKTTNTLTWTAVPYANTTYSLEVKESSDGGSTWGAYTAVAGANALTTNTYSHTGRNASYQYQYRITPKVCNTAGTGSETSSNIIGCSEVAVAPSGLALAAGNTKITATWSAVANATSYKLYRTGYSTNTFTINAPTVTYQDTGLVNNQTYNYQVSAIVCGAESVKSSQLAKVPLDVIPCPSGATVVYNSITYNTVWIDINDNGVENTGECWFKENLATTKKPDGSTNLLHATSGDYAYMCPPNTSNNGEDCASASSGSTSVLGNIYTWATAMNLASSCNSTNCSGSINSPHQGICPTSWHVPSDTEWANLINYAENQAVPTTGSTCATAGNCSNAGKVMKETGTSYWNSTGGSPTNALGFTMRGAGGYAGGWNSRGTDAYLWSATQHSSYPASDAMSRYWYYSNATVSRVSYNKTNLWSVRCVKN